MAGKGKSGNFPHAARLPATVSAPGPESVRKRDFTLADLLNVLRAIKSDYQILLDDLASQFGVDPETMLSVLQQLSSAGVPPYTPDELVGINITTSPKDGRRVVSIQFDKHLETGIRLTRDELYALQLSVDAYLATAVDEARVVAEGVLEKVNRALGMVPDGAGGGNESPTQRALLTSEFGHRIRERLAEAKEGLRRGVKLEIEYYSGHTGKLDSRVVWPLLLREGGGHVYLLAFCELRGANRSFRLDRIRSVKLMAERFPQSELQPAEVPEHVPGWDGTLAVGQFTVRLDVAVKDEAVEEFVPLGAVARELPDGRIDLTLPLYSRPWAIGWVLRLGEHAELLEPEYLRRELVERLKRLAKQFAEVS
jgi:predicted DNA-binding transcriptional regulator YafY